MIIQKKADRRKKRQVDSAKTVSVPAPEKHQQSTGTSEMAAIGTDNSKLEQGDHKRSPKQRTEEIHQTTPKYKAPPPGYNEALTQSPKHHSEEVSSPTNKIKQAPVGYNKPVLNNNTSYTNYHQQPQQQSFAVGK